MKPTFGFGFWRQANAQRFSECPAPCRLYLCIVPVLAYRIVLAHRISALWLCVEHRTRPLMNRSSNVNRLMENRWLSVLLALLVVGIWGAVAYRVAESGAFEEEVTGGQKETLGPPKVQTSKTLTDRQSPYRGDFRDPFAAMDGLFLNESDRGSRAPERRDARMRSGHAEQGARQAMRLRAHLRHLSLIGLIDETALVQRSDETYHLLQKGGRIDSLEVSKVTDAFVLVRLGAHVDTLRLAP